MLKQDRGAVTKLIEEKPHTLRALKLSRCCSKRSKDMGNTEIKGEKRKNKAEKISYPI